MTYLLTFLFMIISVLFVIIILLQRGRGGGLSGAFGSGGGSSSAFGTKTGDVFTTVTVILFIVFMLIAIWLNFRFKDYKEAYKGVTDAAATLPASTLIPSTLPATPATPIVPVPPPAPTTAPTSHPQ